MKNTIDQSNLIEKDENERRAVERDLQDQIAFRERKIDLEDCEKQLNELRQKEMVVDVESMTEKLKKVQSDESNFIDQVRKIKCRSCFIDFYLAAWQHTWCAYSDARTNKEV